MHRINGRDVAVRPAEPNGSATSRRDRDGIPGFGEKRKLDDDEVASQPLSGSNVSWFQSRRRELVRECLLTCNRGGPAPSFFAKSQPPEGGASKNLLS